MATACRFDIIVSICCEVWTEKTSFVFGYIVGMVTAATWKRHVLWCK